MTLTRTRSTAAHSPRPATAGFSALVRVVAVWICRHRSRTSLSRLDPHLLRDIGLDPLAARSEAAKPFWKD